MLRSSILTAIAVAFGVLVSGPGTAQTPDALPPAQEGICDPLHPTQGGTPGLYGLCVAYCEAQDLNEMAEQAKAGGVPGEKILARYRAKMKPGDPDMPCIVSSPTACPCFNSTACQASTDAAICLIQISQVADLFTGQTCADEDLCQNGAFGGTLLAADFCRSTPTSDRIRATAIVFADSNGDGEPDGGLCIAAIGNIGNQVGFITDAATAQNCLNELNTYDGNGPLDGNVSMCMLGN